MADHLTPLPPAHDPDLELSEVDHAAMMLGISRREARAFMRRARRVWVRRL
jgi:hypothetical protein